jgi:hypothetical protein
MSFADEQYPFCIECRLQDRLPFCPKYLRKCRHDDKNSKFNKQNKDVNKDKTLERDSKEVA